MKDQQIIASLEKNTITLIGENEKLNNFCNQ